MERLTSAGRRRRPAVPALAVLVLLLLGPGVFARAMSGLTSIVVWPFTRELEFASSRYEIFNAELLLTYVIVVLGLNLVFQTGMISLGHSAFFLVGAYTLGLTTTALGWSFWLALPAAAAASALVGLVLGVPAIRLGLFTLAMVTVGYAIVSETLVLEWRSITGGGDGLRGIEYPGLFGELESYYWLLVIVVVGTFLLTRNWLRSPLGRAGRATADNPVAAQSIGLDVRMVKVRSFVVSAALAGLAGALYAPLIGFLSPEGFRVDLSVLFLLMVLLGGGGTVAGPILGAVVLFRIPLAVEDITGQAGDMSLLVYGIVLVISVHLVPQGFMSAWRFLRDRVGLGRSAAGQAGSEPVSPDAADDLGGSRIAIGAHRPATSTTAGPVAIHAEGLRKNIGGVQAVDGVDLRVGPGQVHALIGPNGSGKTTTLNLLCGYVPTDAGTVSLGGEPAEGPAHERARRGLARTFQTPFVFENMSCLENVMVALDRHRSVSALAYLLRTRAARAEEQAAYDRAVAILRGVGLDDVEQEASVLPPGRRRLLEIARVIASAPTVVILDEPAAGLGHAEMADLEAAVTAFREGGLAVLLVEHHVDLVRRLADEITVLDFGQVIAHGDADVVRDDPAVVAAYLGTEASAALDDQVEGA